MLLLGRSPLAWCWVTSAASNLQLHSWHALTPALLPAAGEIIFVVIGVVLQGASIVCESVRLTLVQILLQQRGIKLNPISSLYHIAPCCFVFLFLPFTYIELPKMVKDPNLHVNVPLLLASAASAFGGFLSVQCWSGAETRGVPCVRGLMLCSEWGNPAVHCARQVGSADMLAILEVWQYHLVCHMQQKHSLAWMQCCRRAAHIL